MIDRFLQKYFSEKGLFVTRLPGNHVLVQKMNSDPTTVIFTPMDHPGLICLFQEENFAYLTPTSKCIADFKDLKTVSDLEGKEYKLAQFHFHTPSEHQLNGQYYDLEIHFVHKDESGNLAVLGVMIQEGRENETLEVIWNSLPKEASKKDVSEKYLIHLPALLPQNQMSFHYDGSLTTPPCTEEVRWIVFEQPIEMSKEQIKAFQQIYTNNHRPIQPLNEREIIKE